MKKKWVIIPVDAYTREFEGKLLFSVIAALRGYGVVFGNMGEIITQMEHLPKGIFLDKTIVKGKANRFKILKGIGNRVVALDEEGLAYYSREKYISNRTSADALEELECFFSWGEYQRQDLLSAYPEYKDKILSTGNPRLDVLDSRFANIYQNESDKIIKKYGKYILINTNFGTFNFAKGHQSILEHKLKTGKIYSEKQREEHDNKVEFQSMLYEKYIELIQEITKSISAVSVIVRPHPAEDINRWVTALKSIKGVDVVREGNVIPWIMGAEAVIHNSCTTGVESWLMGKKVIAFSPTMNVREAFECDIPNTFSIQCSDIVSVIDTLKNASITNPTVDTEKYISGIDGILASHLMVDRFDKIDIAECQFSGSEKRWLMARLSKPLLGVKAIGRRLRNSSNDRYRRQILKDIRKMDVEQKVRCFESALHTNRKIIIRNLCQNIYLLY